MKKICCPIRENAIHHPSLEALVGSEKSLSYKGLDQLVSKTVKVIKQHGITTKQRVAIWAHNSLEYIIIVFALLRMRAIVCFFNPRFPFTKVIDLLGQVKCQALIVKIKPDVRQSFNFTTIDFNQILDSSQQKCEADNGYKSILLDVSQEATVLFTSGTTASAKAVLHTYGNHWFSAIGANNNIPIVQGDRWLISLGLWHIGGLAILFRCFIAGGTVAIPNDHKLTNKLLEKFRITHISLVPTQLKGLLKKNAIDSSLISCKCVLLGGDLLPETMISRALSLGINIYTTYGCTEMASQVTTTSCIKDIKELLTAGRLLKNRELTISDEGEILVKGKTLFKGYVEGGDLRRPFARDGWFHTGDLGEFLDHGNLIIIGRKDNMFISGGENIQPEEIEAALQSLEFVSRAVVSPAPDREFGFRPIAFVEIAGGHELDKNKLSRLLEKTLPSFKVPLGYYPWPQTTTANSPKIQRSYFKTLAQEIMAST